ncbi:Os03g0169700 [Oryza sativa Japonica Group]|uniref:Os03g0169700 protein n=2 Tax=Oryza sativa subsp. japonica TaxID=39947 RepID=Q0DUS2_ORYSJ|nr:hypothetical protein EE612_015573 [Oryza sativa]BAF11016.1 Os03g0169700 [Oryza sativa Japonica Group]BAS82515.1 Os03g0169700 [Oryza sativa Japonica Group]|eukprot:NP_001049102.1 Os03g0169700 [Oryza sativa Japonica Group]
MMKPIGIGTAVAMERSKLLEPCSPSMQQQQLLQLDRMELQCLKCNKQVVVPRQMATWLLRSCMGVVQHLEIYLLKLSPLGSFGSILLFSTILQHTNRLASRRCS